MAKQNGKTQPKRAAYRVQCGVLTNGKYDPTTGRTETDDPKQLLSLIAAMLKKHQGKGLREVQVSVAK